MGWRKWILGDYSLSAIILELKARNKLLENRLQVDKRQYLNKKLNGFIVGEVIMATSRDRFICGLQRFMEEGSIDSD